MINQGFILDLIDRAADSLARLIPTNSRRSFGHITLLLLPLSGFIMAQQKSETMKIREGYGFLAFYGIIGCIFAYFANDVFRNLLAPIFAVVFAAVGIRLGVLRWKEFRNDASPDSTSDA